MQERGYGAGRARQVAPKTVVDGVDVSRFMMKLTGKDYLQVAGRVLLFRTKHPKGQIHTEIVQLADQSAVFKAVVTDNDGNVLAEAHGSETRQGFPAGWLEKAETVAIGRALAHAGFGTQFATQDFNDDATTKLADAPVAALEWEGL